MTNKTFEELKIELYQYFDFEKAIIGLDFLRSKGFLVPFMNLTTDQILEFGWAKIKNK